MVKDALVKLGQYLTGERSRMRPGVIDRAVSSFPASLEGEVCQVLRVLPSDGGASEHVFTVQLGDERISIPFRIYFNEPGPSVEANLTSQQRTILNCIYLMHHDGFVRQRRLENLLQLHEEFVIPFKVKLLGEYVIEILEVLDKDINETTLPAYVEFIKANPRFWQQTQSRVISYWNEYYRRKFPKLEEYVGFIIVERIKAANNKN